jgi:hypothetical protein
LTGVQWPISELKQTDVWTVCDELKHNP